MKGALQIIFKIFFCLVCFMNHKHETLWLLKNYKLCTLCTLILSNPFHLTIEFKNVVVQILKFFTCV